MKLLRLFLLYGLWITLSVPDSITAQGATYTYYVATTGSDSNPGTLTQPFRTLKVGVARLQPGDTLYIRGGVWEEQIDLRGKTGTPGNYITIAGHPGEIVTLRHTDTVEADYGTIRARGDRGYFIFDNLVLDGSDNSNRTGWQLREGNHHFTLRNLEIKNFKFNGLGIDADAHDISIINCKIHNQISINGQPGERWYGIYVRNGSNILIESNEIYDNPGGGLHIYYGPISNVVIRSNSIHDNNTLASSQVGGIIVQGAGGNIVTNVQIYNNLVYKNGSAPTAGGAPGIVIGPNTNGTKVWNNTIYGNQRYGLVIGYDTSTINTIVQNNISYGNQGGNYIDHATGTLYTHNLTTDPHFVDTSTSNFKLQISSPAIDKGVSLSTVTVDYINQPRPNGNGYDIGAYEVSTSNTQAPTPPIGLSAR